MIDKHRRIRFYCGLHDKYGEVVNPAIYEQAMEDFYHSFTIYRTTGNWRSTREESLVLEVIEMWPVNNTQQAHLESQAVAVARLLKEQGQQQCVLLTIDFVDTFFL